MNQRDLINLFKFMSITFSPNDGEALLAIRKVNNMLQRMGKTWEDMYALCKSAPEASAPPEASDKTNGWEEEITNLPMAMLEKNVNERFKQAGLTQFEVAVRKSRNRI
jgi:hypothetical protein